MKSTDNTLEELGWNAFFREHVSIEEALQCHPFRVMAVHRGKIAVSGAGSDRWISPYIADARSSNDHPTVGDWLLVEDATLQPTRSSSSRPATRISEWRGWSATLCWRARSG